MFSYENLEVYRKAYKTNQKVYRLLKENEAIASYTKNQLGRASLSIMLKLKGVQRSATRIEEIFT